MSNITVIHIISDLACFGGAQNVLCSILPYLDSSQKQIYTLSPPAGSLFNYLKSQGIYAHKLTPLSLIKIIFKSYFIPHYYIHLHLTLPFYLSIFFNSRRIIYTEHSNTNKRRYHFLLSFIDKHLIYPRFQHIIAVSQGVLHSLKHYLPSIRSSITIVPNTISESFTFNSTDIDALISSRLNSLHNPIIVMTARFSYHKYQSQLIHLLSLTKSFRLILIGDGPYLTDAITLAKKLGFEDRITFTGTLSQQDVISILKECTFYIQSSHTEAFGVSALEAMSLGIPTFVSAIPGLVEIAPHSFLAFPNNSLSSLNNRLRYLCNNPSLYSILSMTCYRQSLNYIPIVISALLRSFYSKLL